MSPPRQIRRNRITNSDVKKRATMFCNAACVLKWKVMLIELTDQTRHFVVTRAAFIYLCFLLSVSTLKQLGLWRAHSFF